MPISPRSTSWGLFIALLLSSLSAHSEDLLFHYRLALQNDPKLRGAEANRGAVEDKRAQADAAFYPTIATSASRNRNEQKVATDNFIFSQPQGKAFYSSTEYRLNLSQPIYNPALTAGW